MKHFGFIAGVAVVLLISEMLVFAGSATAPIGGDEAVYALLADRILTSGHWLYLQNWWVSDPYFDKPPLYFWLSAATESLIGFQPFAFRLWSGVFACGAVLCTITVGRNLYNEATGLLAGLLLGTNVEFLFTLGAREGTLNTSIAFLAAVGLVATTGEWPKRHPRLAWLCLSLSAGAAGWLKPLNGLIVIGIVTGVALCHPAAERKQHLRLVAAAAGPAVALNLLWPFLLWNHFGDPFLARIFDWNLVQRFSVGVDIGHLRPWYFYPTIIAWPMTLGWLAAGWRFIRRGHQASDAVVCLVPLVYLATISLTPSKLSQYAFPVLPLLAIAGGALFWQATSWLQIRWRAMALVALAAVLAVSTLQRVRHDLIWRPQPAWERASCPARAESGSTVPVLLTGISGLDQVEGQARSRKLEFYLREFGERLRLADAATVGDLVRRNGPALIFARLTGDDDPVLAALAGREPIWTFHNDYGIPTQTRVFAIALDPQCSPDKSPAAQP